MAPIESGGGVDRLEAGEEQIDPPGWEVPLGATGKEERITMLEFRQSPFVLVLELRQSSFVATSPPDGGG